MKLFLSKHNVSSTNLVYHTYTNTFLPGVPMVVHTYPVISTNMEDLQSIACGLFMRFVLQECEAQTTDVRESGFQNSLCKITVLVSEFLTTGK